MTVTIAWCDHNNKCTFMGADSCASDSINHSTVKNQKVFNPVGRHDILLGCAGTFRLPNLLQYVPNIFPDESELGTDEIDMGYLVNEFTPVIRAITEDFDEADTWELLIAVGDRIYRMQMDMSIIEPADDSDAIGIGGSVALGALKVLNELEPTMPADVRIQHALKVACDTCQGCTPPFRIMKTEECKVKPERNVERPTRGYEIIRSSHEETDDYDDVPKKKKKKKKNKY